MTTEQTDFSKWAWEVVLMLKLHPNQVLMNSMRTLNPQTNDGAEHQQSRDNLSESHDNSRSEKLKSTIIASLRTLHTCMYM